MTTRVMKFVRAFFADGGTEKQFVDLALAFEPERVAVSFGCLWRTGKLADELDARGVPVFDYDVRSFLRPSVLAAQLRLAQDIRRHGIQVVHTYGFASHLFAIPAAKLAGASVVASIRDMGIYLSPAKLRAQRWLCGLADRILVNAGAIRDWLIESGYDAGRISVVPNGMNLMRFTTNTELASDVRCELGFLPDAPLIGVVGRVTRLKGIEDFLRAAAMVAVHAPAARFLVVGGCVNDDANLAELQSLARDMGLRDRAVFTGFRSDVPRILKSLNVSVQPSHSEGLSNALLESMAAGCPVVATRVGGAGEAVRDGDNGLLVKAGDVTSMATAICRILDDHDLSRRLGDAARASVLDHYSMTRVVESTARVYEEISA